MDKVYLGIAGQIGAGKDVLANYLQTYYGAEIFRSSKLLGEILKILHIDEYDRSNLQKLPVALKNIFGNSVIGSAMVADMAESKKQIVVWNGLRYKSDVVALRQKFGDACYIIGIYADENTRFERIKMRGEKTGETEISLAEFRSQSTAETEISIQQIIENADLHINNNGTETDLQSAIEKIILKIKTPR